MAAGILCASAALLLSACDEASDTKPRGGTGDTTNWSQGATNGSADKMREGARDTGEAVKRGAKEASDAIGRGLEKAGKELQQTNQ